VCDSTLCIYEREIKTGGRVCPKVKGIDPNFECVRQITASADHASDLSEGGFYALLL